MSNARAGAQNTRRFLPGGITKFLFCRARGLEALCPHHSRLLPVKPGVEDLPQSRIAHSQAIANVAVSDGL
ncbi:hypothetical protein KCP73_10400 [Salmonella enterica subsp. enterica]|nr:hypothetical protein KCP73_10400 [Salmonella enterica subsp. enterica]